MLSLFKRTTPKTPPAGGLPPLAFHNTLSGIKEEFKPLNHTVRMYNCGPTVYDYVTIGNLRSYIFADTLRRALDAWGYNVKQVINITDFGHLVSDADEGEDKMSKGLRREGLEFTMENMKVLAERYAEAFLEDLKHLGVKTERITFPRASAYITEEIALIKTLEEKGYAYQASDGVYFDTKKFTGYGKLGHRDIDKQEAGARVEVNPEKRNPADFILWKSDSKLGWQSPWGLGFPGWHIECTAMIFTLLGKQIDIHTGGIDHIAIHHNNEIAQAEAATGKQFVRYWMHNEFATVEAKRIGKSVGNAITLRSFMDRGFSPLVLRYWYLTSHYRSPVNFTWDAIEGASTALTRLGRAFLEMKEGPVDEAFLQKFYTCIGNDLGTAQALALIWENLSTLNKTTLRRADNMLGLGLANARPAQKLKIIKQDELPPEVQGFAKERDEARLAKDFAKSDELRAKIEEHGFVVTDSSEGQKITRK